MLAQRVLASCGAACLVAAVALASILPPGEPLGEALANLDTDALPHLQAFELHWLGVAAWQHLTIPVLARPAWLLPLAAGLLCLGAFTSLFWRTQPAKPRRGRG